MNTKYHIHKLDIQCPYCDSIQEKENAPDGFWNPIISECDSCEKKFKLEKEIVFTTHSVCDENKKVHDFKETHIPGFYMCENCEESKRDNHAP